MYVVFDKRRNKQRRLMHLATTRRFNHCFVLIGYDLGGDSQCAMIFDPAADGIHVLVYPDRNIDAALQQAVNEGATAIVHYPHDSREAMATKYIPRGIYTCVSAVKALLCLSGFKSLFVITPLQLFKYLKRNGGTVYYKNNNNKDL